MNLWVDDEKPEPEGWARARSYLDALNLLRRYQYDTVAFDHDLGEDDEPSGYDLLCLMENGELPKPRAIVIISWNAVGAKRMLAVVDRLGVENLGWDLKLSTSGWRSEDAPKVEPVALKPHRVSM